MTDYNKVIRSFISFQDKAGFKLTSAVDGNGDSLELPFDEKSKRAKLAADWVCSCDEGTLTFERDGWYINAYAVLGNEEYCTIADSAWCKEMPQEILKDFDDAWDAFSDKWDT